MKIIVTGIGGPAGKAVAGYLLQQGHEVLGTDCDQRASLQLIADEFYLLPPAIHEQMFSDALLDLVSRSEAQFLVCTVTEELPIVAELADALADWGCKTCISDPNAVVLANDKLMSMFRLHEQGVGVPKTVPHEVDTAHELLGVPCLSKPRWGRGGRGVQVHETADGLLKVPAEPERVFQEFLDGHEYNVALFLEDDLSVRAIQVMRKVGLREGRTGNALSVELVEDDEVAALAIDAARALGVTGPLDVDIREGKGKLGVLEVNARVGATVTEAPEVLDALMRYAERVVVELA